VQAGSYTAEDEPPPVSPCSCCSRLPPHALLYPPLPSPHHRNTAPHRTTTKSRQACAQAEGGSPLLQVEVQPLAGRELVDLVARLTSHLVQVVLLPLKVLVEGGLGGGSGGYEGLGGVRRLGNTGGAGENGGNGELGGSHCAVVQSTKSSGCSGVHMRCWCLSVCALTRWPSCFCTSSALKLLTRASCSINICVVFGG